MLNGGSSSISAWYESLIAAFGVAIGRVRGTAGDTHTKADFVSFLEELFGSTPPATRWKVVCDNRNTHLSTGVARLVSGLCGITEDLGEKCNSGVRQSIATREAFLRVVGHRITFHFMHKHAPWINQIEIWFSLLMRKLLRRGSSSPKEHLQHQIDGFTTYFNGTMAKRFRWTMKEKPLTA